MANHVSRLSLRNFELPKAGSAVEVVAYSDSRGNLGTLQIGRGGLYWRPARVRKADGHRAQGYRKSWSELATFFES